MILTFDFELKLYLNRTYTPVLSVSLDQKDLLFLIRIAEVDIVLLSDFCLVMPCFLMFPSL